ncbi:MAG: class II fumarate hydratase [Francisellaceae bacterium]|nr:class II fumarate hydratase [Francisellaceae bacterium]MBT6207653.1 class II fumarate hydratase [Francisellaceae bacterium]MBT6538291.1 class II fumarate hydratase [Francisellaceae bacterium]
MSNTRMEKDSMGELSVPVDALYAAQTQRAVQNFPISGIRMPRAFIKAISLVKAAAAQANASLELISNEKSTAIVKAALSVSEGQYDEHFPVDVFQTGSGTSSNMNANEVIANLATQGFNEKIHPNDDVNMSQSSNDVIPTSIAVSASIEVHSLLIPALKHLKKVLEKKASKYVNLAKTGRTHLMDAMPVTLQQELLCWAQQIDNNLTRLTNIQPDIQALTIGGTAVGSGINAHPDFGRAVCDNLSSITPVKFTTRANYFEGLSCQDAMVSLSGCLKNVAVSLMKISNDLRWMNSGPLAGIGEIALPAVQPGSSIMPGKVNPVIPESLCMICAQVIGNDTTVTIAGQSGNFQLNVMLPIISLNVLQSIEILSSGAVTLANKAIKDFTVNEENISIPLDKNPILVTALNRVIGYEKGASIAKKAYKEQRTVLDVAKEMTDLSEEEIKKYLNPLELTKGGVHS